MVKAIEIHGFPADTSPEDAKVFVERITGRGTIYALEVVRPKRRGHRGYVKIQFVAKKYADLIVSLAERNRICNGRIYMRTRKMNNDFAQRQRVFLHSLDHVTLNFGCQISKEKFHVLWKKVDVKVRFGLGMGKIYFFMSHCSIEYKLILSCENIWQIELRRPRSQNKQFLLIQLVGGPRIYEKEVPEKMYYKEDTDDQWIRQLDFTPERFIGQSSSLCLEIPPRSQLPTSVYTRQCDLHFMLHSGSSFSHALLLVPVVTPPPALHLPFDILFKINSLLQHGCLPGPSIDARFFQLVDPKTIDVEHIEHALNKLYNLKECCYDPVKWLYDHYQTSHPTLRPPTMSLLDGLVYVRRVQITPSKVYFGGPEVNLSNRVLRNYIADLDSFIRVSFVDEELNKLFSPDLSPRLISPTEERQARIYDRVLSILRHGITIGDKKFEFLAFSSSQLRENSVWMFASRLGLTAADIREWMGDFRDIRNVAKYAARLGQSFGSSRETLSVGSDEVEFIPDVEVVRGGVNYVFSDGIGKISEELAFKVGKKIGFKNSTPSAFQIRYGGCKGVVAIDPTSTTKLSLRQSMSKYKSSNTKLDVLSWSKYHPCFLNRQLITLLSTLGVKDRVFEKKQREAVAQLDSILTNPVKAREALEMMAPGENSRILKEMLLCGYKPDGEPFLSMMMQTIRASKLLDLRLKTRIFIPNGRAMMGCLDETKLLEYGEVFVQVSSFRRRQYRGNSSSYEQSYIVEGNVVVAKNPCLHPGDVRVLKAVNLPSLRHMTDCVVFPQKGKRPHPNECSGSDLDGDIYFVCWDSDLIPPRQIQPMDYTPSPTIILDHHVSIQEVQKYFADYIANDTLGIIANAHTVFADKESGKAMSDPCIQLAQLFSIAVDFPKTGVPAKIPPHLRVKQYPDFMEKPERPTYESQSVIGKLYREIKDISSDKSLASAFTREASRQLYDPDMEVEGLEAYLDDALQCKMEYEERLVNLMEYYGIKTEAEILSGSVVKMGRSFSRKMDMEAVNYAVSSLRKEARAWFGDKEGEDVDVYAKASAWYYVTYHPKYWGSHDHFLSFPWCVSDKLLQIKRNTSLRLYLEDRADNELQLT